MVNRHAAPELPDYFRSTKMRRVQTSHGLRQEVGPDAQNAYRDGNLIRHGYEIGIVLGLFADLLTCFLDGFFRREIFVGVFDSGQEPAVGDAFRIENQESGGSARLLRYCAPAND